MKKILLVLTIAALGAAVYWQREAILDWYHESQKPNVPEVAFEDVDGEEGRDEVEDSDVGAIQESPEEPVEEPAAEPIKETEDEFHPAEFNLAVPFTSQAPHGNWELPYQELCEEASSLMAAAYFRGDPAGKIDPDKADTELLKLVEFEESFFGYYKDTTAEETALLIEAYYHLTTELMTDPTVEQIKVAVAAGFPVIVPAAGRLLGNPNFTPPGPVYHMLVIKGYTESGFITNDPGTRLGADYFYSFDAVMNAMHDWNGGDVENGTKVVIVVKP